MRIRGLSAAAAMAALSGAAWAASDVQSSGLVVLNTSAAGALTMTGNSSIEIPTRVAYVNSSSDEAVETVGRAVLDVPALYICGDADFGGRSYCTGEVHPAVAPFADPCGGTPFPSIAGMADQGGGSISSGSSVTLTPGYYSQGVSISGNSTVTLQPGTYVFGGDGLNVSSGRVSGDGVTLVIASGEMRVAGQSEISLSPPSSGAMSGMVICQPPTNHSDMHLAGGSSVQISGTIYVPGARLELVGNSEVEGQGPQMGDLVVADRLRLTGTSTIRIGREDLPRVQLPSLPLFD